MQYRQLNKGMAIGNQALAASHKAEMKPFKLQKLDPGKKVTPNSDSLGLSGFVDFRQRLLVLVSLLGLSVFANDAAFAARVVLSNGDVVQGELVQLTDDTLVLKSAILGELKMPFAEVKSLQEDRISKVELSDGSVVQGRIDLNDKQQLKISGDQVSSNQNLKREQLASINKAPPQVGVKYSGRANLGGTFNRGNSEEETFNLDAELVARAVNSRYTVGLEVNEGNSGDSTTTSNSLLRTKYDSFLSEKNYLFVAALAERDKLADLNLRSSLGAGYGRQIYENETLNLSAEAGLSYVNEDYELAQDESFPSLSLGLKYDQMLFDKAVILFNDTRFSFNLENNTDSLVKNRLGLRFPMGQGLNVSAQLNLDYDNEPAAGTKKTDSSLIFSLGYGF